MKKRYLTATAVLAFSWACSSMQAVPIDFIAQAKPAVVDVKGQYGVHLSVANPVVSGDTVFGTAAGGNTAIAVPVREIDRITTRRFSSVRTAMLIGGAAVLGGMAAYFAATGGDGGWTGNDCSTINRSDPNERERCGF